MELTVAVGQSVGSRPGAAEVRTANTAHRGRFDQFEPIFHTLDSLLLARKSAVFHARTSATMLQAAIDL